MSSLPVFDGPQKIVATNLFKKYGERTVVSEISLEVKRGEVVGLLGPNGAGKTTSFYMIMGLVKPDGGKVTLGDTEITRWSMHHRARAGIGYLAQDTSVFRKLSVEDNIHAILQLMPMSPAQRRERCDELLENFDLTARRGALGMSLSGGERRRTEIARVLASSPQFILLDEPLTGIDPKQVEEVQNIISHLKKLGIGVLITDHAAERMLTTIDRGLILFDGRIAFEGTPEELINNKSARELYFGESIVRHM
ncbi:lipopolysaccharide export system ATP-binding protein [Abditibacterium utsteinense]|uniref:Lipopolysaccharide export system ATP-binding protein n=1 Tax=Abditibacterium utsteinense TaxID=1960156 RepID=A0A2S8SUX9_9BACT|nr:LPS export ABC transporter ATP-binding protein [Abditibacterium utsteinense]PQV64584.1 lipopolysaccharide export system ATP-binding protein [Abditibacterium utsteinense]